MRLPFVRAVPGGSTLALPLSCVAVVLLAACGVTQPAPTAVPPSVEAATPEPTAKPTISERDALAALYESAGGQYWTRSDNWLSDAPLRDWYGVVTNGNGQIIGLNLYGNELSGEIPPELGNIVNLTHLEFGSNYLGGVIPRELGNLTNLEWLELGGNHLSGPIPLELGNLVNLEWLSLWGNQLTGPIPPELGNLADLEWLYLGPNQLSGPIPPELGDLTNLERLELAGNQLSGKIPPELGNLLFLRTLGLYENQLSGPIPQELGFLAALERLGLRDNRFSGCIPKLLRNVSDHDMDNLGLPFCSVSGPASMSPDRDALESFYMWANGESWDNNENWMSDRPIGDWHGVMADGDGRS